MLLIPHLGGGGAERVATLLAQHLDSSRFDVHLALMLSDSPGALTLPASVTVHRLNAARVRYAALKLTGLLWRVRPQILLSSMAHLNFMVLALRAFLPGATRIVVRQNTTASAAATVLSGILYRTLYPLADAIICQSESMAEDLKSCFGLPRRKLHVLPNPIKPASNTAYACDENPDRQPHLLCVSRLAREKGVDLLLHAMLEIRISFPCVRLTILGTGPESRRLMQLTDELGLHGCVTFAGYADPAPYFAAATLFVSPSRYEGMPNALLEAAAAGLPIVTTPSSQGLIQLLRGAPYVWTSKDVSASGLASSLLEALKNLEQLPDGSARIRHTFLEPFTVTTAVRAYEEELLNV